MTQDQKRSRVGRAQALCHPKRRVVGWGLCRECYTRRRTSEAPELEQYVAEWVTAKQARIAANQKRRAPKKQSEALCHPGRLMVAKGLCGACYQRHAKGNAPELEQHVTEWVKLKGERIDNNTRATRARSNAKRTHQHRKLWTYTLQKRYGIDADTYEKMLHEQNDACFICEETPPDGRRLYVDHCHTHGHVRRLLCPRCNTLVGLIETGEHLLPKIHAYLEVSHGEE